MELDCIPLQECARIIGCDPTTLGKARDRAASGLPPLAYRNPLVGECAALLAKGAGRGEVMALLKGRAGPRWPARDTLMTAQQCAMAAGVDPKALRGAIARERDGRGGAVSPAIGACARVFASLPPESMGKAPCGALMDALGVPSSESSPRPRAKKSRTPRVGVKERGMLRSLDAAGRRRRLREEVERAMGKETPATRARVEEVLRAIFEADGAFPQMTIFGMQAKDFRAFSDFRRWAAGEWPGSRGLFVVDPETRRGMPLDYLTAPDEAIMRGRPALLDAESWHKACAVAMANESDAASAASERALLDDVGVTLPARRRGRRVLR